MEIKDSCQVSLKEKWFIYPRDVNTGRNSSASSEIHMPVVKLLPSAKQLAYMAVSVRIPSFW